MQTQACSQWLTAAVLESNLTIYGQSQAEGELHPLPCLCDQSEHGWGILTVATLSFIWIVIAEPASQKPTCHTNQVSLVSAKMPSQRK